MNVSLHAVSHALEKRERISFDCKICLAESKVVEKNLSRLKTESSMSLSTIEKLKFSISFSLLLLSYRTLY